MKTLTLQFLMALLIFGCSSKTSNESDQNEEAREIYEGEEEVIEETGEYGEEVVEADANAQENNEVVENESVEVEDYSFDLELDGFGQVRFVSKVGSWVEFSLSREGNAFYKFQTIPRNEMVEPAIKGVEIYDADKDGRQDVLVMLSVRHPESLSDQIMITLYLNMGNQSFKIEPGITKMAIESLANTFDEFKNVAEHYFTYQTVRIGPDEKWKTLNLYFEDAETKKTNVHFILDDLVFYDEKGIWIEGKNLIIEGGENTRLYCESESDNVMQLSWATNVTLKNLKMMHKAENLSADYSNCTGRVLAFDGSTDIVVDGCDLNGCGLAGLHDNTGNKNILVRNTKIHNCSLGAYTDINENVWQEPTDHEVFTFENTEMYNNGPDRVREE